ncbi:uncharacterized protein FIESC28_10285 [Fusarium coffeatum]|uniref:Clr5 domain-containing protein n=1 Tax=Fusarium coffeatum TaxID=231269 RepID=A0A366QTT8_9HYPO|nr:uncharacterized protein FIESC28_10285 [Fusarium coffeatum]RBR08339.1 hypothetical protein FIESC28_10285 [Fusarium coffeatum]
MSSNLPALAPKQPGCPQLMYNKTLSKEHSQEEWEAVRQVIAVVYIEKNRTLEETMAILHNVFRFATSGPYAKLEQVLYSVSNWSRSKLEFSTSIPDPMFVYLANLDSPPSQDSRTMYRIFELSFDLWYHGKGDLAGRAIRRGFYLLEFVLHEEHPDMLWHILDTIYDMAWKGYLDLMGMFLKHATAFAKQKLADLHPLRLILQELTTRDSCNERGFFCDLLRQAWLRNVDLLGKHIETSEAHQLWPYEQLIWDGSIPLRTGSDLIKQEKAIYQALERMDPAQSRTSNTIDTDRLRVKALRLEFTQTYVGDRGKAEELANDLLEIESVTGPRLTDRFHAHAYKMLARLQEEKKDWDMAEQNLQCAISKRESAHASESNLRVIADMWVLAAHYQRAGREPEAKNIVDRALERASECVTQMIT